ncbi:MAG: hypothetical protein HY720_31340 [Planctomycetes bacterium]|nr:hypothetical protein [Planctomycetota bacterium]
MRNRSVLLLVLSLPAVLAACSPGEEPAATEGPPPGREGGPLARDGGEPPAGATGTIRGRFEGDGEAALYVRLRPVAVYVEKVEGKTFEPPAEEACLDQKDYEFVPRVLPILVGTTVRFTNSDDVRHNVHDSGDPSRLDFSFRLGEVRTGIFEEPGVVTIRCRYHSQMVAYLVVVETPWFATSDEEGAFEIDRVPPGNYRLTFWHEKIPATSLPVHVEAGGTTEAIFRP